MVDRPDATLVVSGVLGVTFADGLRYYVRVKGKKKFFSQLGLFCSLCVVMSLFTD